jgi:hypothetical protein
MNNNVLEIEADSLQTARQQAKAQVPAGLCMLSETILSDGKQSTAKGVADSASAALEKARKDVPDGAEIVSEKELVPTSHRSIEVEAFDEQAARLSAEKTIGWSWSAKIERVILKTEGKKGFLGMGKKPNLYQVTVFQPSVAEVRFGRKAKIRVEIGEIPSSGYCQRCGRPNSPAEKSEKSVHFFCSPACRDNYYKAKLGAVLFDPGRFIINASGQDISGMMASGRAMAATATSYCWSCRAIVPMTEDKCGSCRVAQEIKL